jgi:photosynthetic reaction center cytochrome c subunit
MPPGLSNTIGKRATFWVVFLTVMVLLLGASLWVVGFVRGTVVTAAEAETRTTASYINYWIGQGYITDEANAAISAYILEFPEPQNVKVLTGLNTSQVWSYMTSQVAGGLQVNCTYCHVLGNFGAETLEEYEALGGDEATWQRKITARSMLLMTQDLNQNWLTQLAAYPDGFEEGRTSVGFMSKQPSGAQISCATCHLGEPIFNAWEDSPHAIPDDYRLPLRNAETGEPGTAADIDMALLVTGKDDQYSLDQVQYNQHTMYHMNESLGVGCTHCHNSRYFPSWEQPAKYYSYTMLQMNQHLLAEYSDILNNQEPSCWMCHRQQVRPPGAAVSASSLPDVLTSEYAP